jgi:polyisoprenoid-binding protein YceI
MRSFAAPRRSLLLALPALLAGRAAPALAPMRFDARHGALGFSVPVFGLARLTGRFEAFTVEIGPERLDIAADATSLRVSWSGMEERARGPDWFDVQAFPAARFEARFGALPPGRPALVDGTLALRGRALPFRMEALWRPDAALEAEGRLSRAAFGMVADRGAVGDQVTLALSVRRQVQ